VGRNGDTWHVWRLDVVVAGDPIGRLNEAIGALSDLHLIPAGAIWSVSVGHDDGCPVDEGGMSACTCEVVHLEARRAL
jgi:hypothetical protein